MPSWHPGDAIPLDEDRVLRVIDTRLDEGMGGDPVSVLVVEPAYEEGFAEKPTSA